MNTDNSWVFLGCIVDSSVGINKNLRPEIYLVQNEDEFNDTQRKGPRYRFAENNKQISVSIPKGCELSIYLKKDGGFKVITTHESKRHVTHLQSENAKKFYFEVDEEVPCLIDFDKSTDLPPDEKPYPVGFTRTYIHDHRFDRVIGIEPEEVILLAKTLCPDVVVGAGGYGTCAELTMENIKDNNWLNKLFLVIMNDGHNALAIYRHDDGFGLYSKRI